MIDVSICICTFRRPDGLLRLLRSLGRLSGASPRREIIVADNDAAGSGAVAVRQARAEGLEVHYLIEPVRGIARARNRSVAPARGEFVAFVDDDEEVEPDWLANLYAEVGRHDADAGIGPVLPQLPPETPRWLAEGGFFDRPRWPTGTRLGNSGVRTGNALIRRRYLTALVGPFDERYALTGGEDTDFFIRLHALGCRTVAVDNAVVYEHLPPNRATVRWLLRRRFLIGMGGARFYAARTPGVRPLRQGTRWLASGLAAALKGAALFPVSPARGLDHLALAARDLGRVAFYSGFTYEPYAQDSFR
ncbi:MAG: glycosyltransferase family 2 protein [Candidatus Binatia bacterium]